MTGTDLWRRVLSEMPLIAILRGIRPAEVLEVGEALHEAGFLCMEVPLNSPDPLISIERLRDRFDGLLLIGAGTVLNAAQLDLADKAGAQLVVSPNSNPGVIRATKERNLISLPGIATPTEAFAAIDGGADGLKLFPAEGAPPQTLRALKAVLPAELPVFPVGGITPEAMAAYHGAGAAGFGIGGAVYKPGMAPNVVRARAEGFVKAWRALH